MASRYWYYKIIIKVIFITLTALAITYFFLKKQIDFSVYFSLILILQVVSLIKFINKTNQKIAFFFNAIDNDDSSIHFSLHKKNKSVKDLHKSLNRVNSLIQKIKIENRQKEQYFHSILEQASVGLLTLNKKGHILFANKTVKSLLNYEQLNHIQQLKRIDEKLFALVSKLKSFDQKLISLTNERETVRLSIRSKPITIGDEKLTLVIIQNVNTELDVQETETWVKLFKVLTHEIMNSITPITSLSETISNIFKNGNEKILSSELSNQDIEKAIKGLDVINAQGKDLIAFVESYRALTKIPKPEKKIISVETLFNKIRILSSQEKGFHDIKFEVFIISNDLEVYADEKQIIQVLLNITKNAIQSINKTPNINGCIKLKAEKDINNIIKISVIDNGMGIKPENLDQIFIPFFSTKKDGSGIGLSFSKYIMQLHGGSLQINSSNKKLTEFTLSF